MKFLSEFGSISRSRFSLSCSLLLPLSELPLCSDSSLQSIKKTCLYFIIFTSNRVTTMCRFFFLSSDFHCRVEPIDRCWLMISVSSFSGCLGSVPPPVLLLSVCWAELFVYHKTNCETRTLRNFQETLCAVVSTCYSSIMKQARENCKN